MFSFLKKYRLPIVVLLLILIPLFNLSSTIKSPQDLKWYDRAILWLVSPLQKTITMTFDTIISLSNHYVMLVGVKKENEKLHYDNSNLIGLINQMRETEKENERLRELLAFKQKYLPSAITAQVIARDTTSEYQTIRLDKGTDVGLKRRMPVITLTGIVGQLIHVGSRTSDVLLLTDHNHSLDIIIQRSRAHGILKGGIEPYCELKYLARTDDVVVGDTLITSGIEGIFPKGLSVGTVTGIQKQKYGITQRVEVSPAVNFSKLEEVFVVTDLSSVKVPISQ